MNYVPGQVRHWRRSAVDLTYEDLHVSEPVSAFVAEMALTLADMTKAEWLDALVGLAEDGHDVQAIEHALHHELVRRRVCGLI